MYYNSFLSTGEEIVGGRSSDMSPAKKRFKFQRPEEMLGRSAVPRGPSEAAVSPSPPVRADQRPAICDDLVSGHSYIYSQLTPVAIGYFLSRLRHDCFPCSISFFDNRRWRSYSAGRGHPGDCTRNHPQA